MSHTGALRFPCLFHVGAGESSTPVWLQVPMVRVRVLKYLALCYTLSQSSALQSSQSLHTAGTFCLATRVSLFLWMGHWSDLRQRSVAMMSKRKEENNTTRKHLDGHNRKSGEKLIPSLMSGSFQKAMYAKRVHSFDR